ncbi:MAG: hypothetical protein ACRCZS_22335, partial [Chroococcidiopsis sp.]
MSDCKLSQLKFLQLRLLQRYLAAIAFTSSLLVMSLGNNPVIAQTTAYCQESEAVRQEKESLLQKA